MWDYRNPSGRLSTVPSRVIVLAGPSGAGKSRLAERLGLPVLRLDDFYKDADAPDLPRFGDGPNAGMVDWDDPASWDHAAAVAGLTALCTTGCSDVPDYSIPLSRRVGHRVLSLEGSSHFVAEGIFAAEVVADCAAAGLLESAYCITQHPWITFWRRLQRDLRERRKSPWVLVTRGFSLMRLQRQVVAAAVAKGCRPSTPDRAQFEIMAAVAAHSLQD